MERLYVQRHRSIGWGILVSCFLANPVKICAVSFENIVRHNFRNGVAVVFTDAALNCRIERPSGFHLNKEFLSVFYRPLPVVVTFNVADLAAAHQTFTQKNVHDVSGLIFRGKCCTDKDTGIFHGRISLWDDLYLDTSRVFWSPSYDADNHRAAGFCTYGARDILAAQVYRKMPRCRFTGMRMYRKFVKK